MLKHLRLWRGISSAEAAKALNISRAEYSCYEEGLAIPDIKTMEPLSELYKMPLAAYFCV